MWIRRGAILLGLALATAGCGQEFKLPPTPPPEPIPDAGRYQHKMTWNLDAPTDLAVRGAYLYVITQKDSTRSRGSNAGAARTKGQVEVFLTTLTNPTPPPRPMRPFTGLEDPTRICVVQSEPSLELFVLVSDRHEVMRTDTTSVVDHIDSTLVGGQMEYDTTFVTEEVVAGRSWQVKRFAFTGGAPLDSFPLPGGWDEVTGLTADEQLNVYASDRIQDVIAKFDSQGRLLKQLSMRGTGDGYINQARGLDWSAGELITADTGQDRVVFLDRDVENTATRRPIPVPGDSTSAFGPRRPEDVSGERTGSFLYIADTGRDRILKYSLISGGFVDSVYSARAAVPLEDGPILAPRFIAVEERLVFVSDQDNNRLVTFALADSF